MFQLDFKNLKTKICYRISSYTPANIIAALMLVKYFNSISAYFWLLAVIALSVLSFKYFEQDILSMRRYSQSFGTKEISIERAKPIHYLIAISANLIAILIFKVLYYSLFYGPTFFEIFSILIVLFLFEMISFYDIYNLIFVFTKLRLYLNEEEASVAFGELDRKQQNLLSSKRKANVEVITSKHSNINVIKW